jgi:hypothetical protein
MANKTLFIGALIAGCIGSGVAWSSDIEISVSDLTPKFSTFYRAAMAQQASPDRRFVLWGQDYDFAAVPPTPEGDLIARRLLDAAWPKYSSVMARIEKGEAGLEPSPDLMLRRVVAQLKPDSPVHIAVLAYVGTLETNAFTTTGKDGVPTVAAG